MLKTLEWVVNVNPEEARQAAAALRAKYPNAPPAALARKVFTGARWKAAAVGVATGAPGNPFLSGGAAFLDVGAVFRLEARAAAQVALIYDEHFFDDEDAFWELLVPIFGFGFASQMAREAGVKVGVALSRHAIQTYLSKGALQAFRRVALKYFGIKVTQRALITKTVPIVGGLIGGTWNFAELSLLRNRCIAYFEGRELGVVPAQFSADN